MRTKEYHHWSPPSRIHILGPKTFLFTAFYTVDGCTSHFQFLVPLCFGLREGDPGQPDSVIAPFSSPPTDMTLHSNTIFSNATHACRQRSDIYNGSSIRSAHCLVLRELFPCRIVTPSIYANNNNLCLLLPIIVDYIPLHSAFKTIVSTLPLPAYSLSQLFDGDLIYTSWTL